MYAGALGRELLWLLLCLPSCFHISCSPLSPTGRDLDMRGWVLSSISVFSIVVVVSHCALVTSELSEGASGQGEVRAGLLGEVGA